MMNKGHRSGKPFRPYRKKQCLITKNNIKKIEFTDIELLNNFVAKDGRILSCRATGTKPRIQRQIAKAIKTARQMGLMPYTDKHKQI